MTDTPPPASAPGQPVPLVVDLDGTLIRTDLLWESLARLLRRNPFAIVAILFWWVRGRAWLKQKLAARVCIDPATLPFNEKFVAYLREQKKSGRKLVLATASDFRLARPVADYTGLFDEVLASDGKTNLRSAQKLAALVKKFGERGFDYAGNSSADFAVWRGAREAVVVNASRRVLHEAANCTKLGPTFLEGFSPVAIAKSFCTELFWRSGYLVAIGAGLLLAAAFPGFDLAGFAWVAPGLMIAAAHGLRGADAFRVGCAAGLAFWLASLYWLLYMPVTGLPVLGWLALAAYLALFQGTWVWLVSTFNLQPSAFNSWSGRTWWTLTGAAAWVGLEMIRARLFSGFPWSFIGVSQFKLVPLIQIASVTGVYGVSFLVVWFSLALFSAGLMIFRHPSRRHVWQAEIVFPLIVLVLLFVLGMARTRPDDPAAVTLRVTLIQPSIPQTLLWDPTGEDERFQKFLAQNEAALTNGTDLLVWPESAVPDMSAANCELISSLARRHHISIILNGEDVATPPPATNYFNAAFLVNPDGRLAGVYHKQRLVIFGEYVPLVRWLPFLQWFTPITGGWTAGTQPAQFEIKLSRAAEDEPTNVITLVSDDGSPAISPRQEITASPLICFEDTFPGVARGAASDDTDLLVNLTNDGWFRDGTEQWQHCANAVFRAVENGLPLVRCANNGVTCWIDARGGLQKVFTDKSGDIHGPGALTVEIPLPARRAPTFYHRHGDWFGWGCVGVTLLLLCRKMRK
jgi:apolipoprotein N-acyltransferase